MLSEAQQLAALRLLELVLMNGLGFSEAQEIEEFLEEVDY